MTFNRYLIYLGVLILFAAGILYLSTKELAAPAGPDQPDQASQEGSNEPQEPSDDPETTPDTSESGSAPPPATASGFVAPLDDYPSRVTKKTFGTFVEPGNSPVTPEKFRGYHSAIDLEILPGEENVAVPVKAICNGPLAVKRMATGYGGLVAQYCTYQGQDILVLYGHLALSSVSKNLGGQVAAGEVIGNLGQPGPDTDDERKHLHLGIRKGRDLVVLGYVQSPAGLDDFLDPRDIIPS